MTTTQPNLANLCATKASQSTPQTPTLDRMPKSGEMYDLGDFRVRVLGLRSLNDKLMVLYCRVARIKHSVSSLTTNVDNSRHDMEVSEFMRAVGIIKPETPWTQTPSLSPKSFMDSLTQPPIMDTPLPMKYHPNPIVLPDQVLVGSPFTRVQPASKHTGQYKKLEYPKFCHVCFSEITIKQAVKNDQWDHQCHAGCLDALEQKTVCRVCATNVSNNEEQNKDEFDRSCHTTCLPTPLVASDDDTVVALDDTNDIDDADFEFDEHVDEVNEISTPITPAADDKKSDDEHDNAGAADNAVEVPSTRKYLSDALMDLEVELNIVSRRARRSKRRKAIAAFFSVAALVSAIFPESPVGAWIDDAAVKLGWIVQMVHQMIG